MNCPNCNVEMKLSSKSVTNLEVRIERTPISYIRNDGNQYVPQINICICPNADWFSSTFQKKVLIV